MKLAEAIEQVKKEKPHSFSMDHCTLFVNEVEQQVQEYMGIAEKDRVKYVWENDGKKELIAPAPYCALYISYLKAKIDYSNEEYESYATNQAQFESDFSDFKAWAVREKKTGKKLPDKIINWGW
jgi:hypothetical protein